MIFSTERLVIRPWTHAAADVDRIFDIYSRWEVARWLGASPQALRWREQAEAAVDRWALRADGRFGVWAVQVRESGLVAGTVVLVPLTLSGSAGRTGAVAAAGAGEVGHTSGVDVGHASGVEVGHASEDPDPLRARPAGRTEAEVEVGWHLHPDCWGRGYATEAAQGALAWGFGGGLTEIYAVVCPDNEPSMAVCRRLGMVGLGVTSRYYDTDLEVFRAAAGPEKAAAAGREAAADPEEAAADPEEAAAGPEEAAAGRQETAATGRQEAAVAGGGQ